MPAGDKLEEITGRMVEKDSIVSLLEDATAAGNGVWIDYSKAKDSTIEILQSVVGASFSALNFEVRGSNNPKVKPADADDGYKIGNSITALGGFTVNQAARWLKLKPVTLTVGVGTPKIQARIYMQAK